MECIGYLLYNRIVVPDVVCANEIYWNGFYGTFLGVPKPRKKQVNSPLELSLIEALYLLKNKRLTVIRNGEEISAEELYKYGVEKISRFRELYIVYEDLRKRGFIVRRGLKFGCDYLVYKYGPGIDHAPYGVQVFKVTEKSDPIEFVRLGRLLHSVRKKLIIAIVINSDIRYIIFDWWKP